MYPPTDPPALDAAAPASSELPFDKSAWLARIQGSKDATQDIIEQGKKNVRKYRNKPLKSRPRADVVAVPVDFTKVEAKRPQLFYQVPEVQLNGLTPESEKTAPLSQAVLNQYLGPSKINIKSTMDEILFDILCPVGFGVICLGYETKTRTVPAQVDPMTMQPMGPPTQVPIWEQYFAHRVAPGLFLIDPDFTGSDFDRALWLGYRRYKNVPAGTPGATSRSKDDDRLLSDPKTKERGGVPRKWGTVVWYRTIIEDPDAHPDAFRTFTWWDGDDAPEEHRDSPFQTTDANGKLGGLLSNPIKVLTLRYVSDCAFPPSDCDITRNIVDERSRGRTQLLQHRNRTLPVTFFDSTRVGKEAMEKIEKGDIDQLVGIPSVDPTMFVPLQQADLKPTNYEFDRVAEKDTNEAWALSPNQSGMASENVITATEAQTMKAGADTRLDYERGKVALFFCEKIAASVMTLIQLFADQTSYVQMLGGKLAPQPPQGMDPMAAETQAASNLVAWNKQNIQGEFAFSVKLNSQLRPDTTADQQRAVQWLNVSAPSPHINQAENWKMMAHAFGLDPSLIIAQPQPPAPEKPKVSISIKGEDLSPLSPQYANVLQILTAQGVEGLAPVPAPIVNPTQETTAEQAPVLSKHTGDLTGRLPGGGSVVKQQSDGTVQ